jgi:alkylated DNA repair protein alkB family protein 8
MQSENTIAKAGVPTQKIVPVCGSHMGDGARKLEEECVFNVYDQIAPHFSHTRYKMWPKVAEFVSRQPSGAFLMDAGCGNGKNLTQAAHVTRFASDRSFPFCEMARKVGKCDSIQADISRDVGKSFRSKIFDAVIAIAVIHHIPTIEGRVQALREIHRLLKPGGRALIYVWAMEQKKDSIGARQFESQDIYVPWNLQSKYLKADKGVPEGQIVPLMRYYHVFTESEFHDLLRSVPELKVESIYYDNNNWAAEISA